MFFNNLLHCLKPKAKPPTRSRKVTYPCAWCGKCCRAEHMRVVGINDNKVRICRSHTA